MSRRLLAWVKSQPPERLQKGNRIAMWVALVAFAVCTMWWFTTGEVAFVVVAVIELYAARLCYRAGQHREAPASKAVRFTRLRAWFRQPPVLMRWKVAVTGVAVMTLASGLYYQTRYLNEERVHDAACARAEGREAVRLVLFQVTSLSDVFGHSDTVDLYESSRRSIIEAVLPPIEVAGCPKA